MFKIRNKDMCGGSEKGLNSSHTKPKLTYVINN